MTNDDLDRLLESHDDIVPSSGFTDAVMAAVRHEAVEDTAATVSLGARRAGPLIAVLVVVLSVASGFVRPGLSDSAVPGVVENGRDADRDRRRGKQCAPRLDGAGACY
jgi:hypothetical protein